MHRNVVEPAPYGHGCTRNDNQVNILRQCAALSTATARRLQDSIEYMDAGAAEASYASFGTNLRNHFAGLLPDCLNSVYTMNCINMHQDALIQAGSHVLHVAIDSILAAAVAKPALLLPLEQANAQDAKLTCFIRREALTRLVIIVQKLLTSA